MADTVIAAAQPNEDEYNASIGALMDKIGVACNGAPMGVMACALFNVLCHVAEQTTPDMRKVMLESTSELAANIEAFDALMH